MIRKFFCSTLLLLVAACTTQAPDVATPTAPGKAPSLEMIAEGVWIHKSYKTIKPSGPVLSQGLVIQTDAGVFLVDTMWDDADTEILLTLIEAETGQLPKAAIVTHAHADKMGGMNALHRAGVETHGYLLTAQDAPARNLIPPQGIFRAPPSGAMQPFEDQLADYESNEPLGIYTYIPGAAHTRDNIVVYYEPAKILFGGCMIRPGRSLSLGNTADGDIANWANAVRKTADTFYDAQIVIPSHGPLGGRELFDHTIALAKEASRQ